MECTWGCEGYQSYPEDYDEDRLFTAWYYENFKLKLFYDPKKIQQGLDEQIATMALEESENDSDYVKHSS